MKSRIFAVVAGLILIVAAYLWLTPKKNLIDPDLKNAGIESHSNSKILPPPSKEHSSKKQGSKEISEPKREPKEQDIAQIIPENLQLKVLDLLRNNENYWAYVDELNKIWTKLGEDEVGKAAYQLILQSILVRMGLAPGDVQNINCLTQKSCPYSLQSLYKESLSRLPVDELPYGKLMLMEHLTASDLAHQDKMEILTSELTDQKQSEVTAMSVRKDNGQFEVSEPGYFLIRAQETMMQISQDKEAIRSASYKAMAQTPDPVIKTALAINLIRQSQADAEKIYADLLQAGVSESVALELMVGMIQSN